MVDAVTRNSAADGEVGGEGVAFKVFKAVRLDQLSAEANQSFCADGDPAGADTNNPFDLWAMSEPVDSGAVEQAINAHVPDSNWTPTPAPSS